MFGALPPKPPQAKPAVKLTPVQISVMLAGISVGSKACKWIDAAALMDFAVRKHNVNLADYSPRGRFIREMDTAVDVVIKEVNENGAERGCDKIAAMLERYLPDYQRRVPPQ